VNKDYHKSHKGWHSLQTMKKQKSKKSEEIHKNVCKVSLIGHLLTAR